jgi:MFS family permease
MFGGFGPAVAGVVAGALVEWASWRAAFIVPGLVVMLTGVALVCALRAGWIPARTVVRPNTRAGAASTADAVKVYLVLTAAMLVNGFIYQATQASLPKMFEGRLDGLLGPGTVGVGTAMMIVYGIAGLFQVVSGHLADRYSTKWVYAAMLVLQTPVLALAAAASGLPLLLVAVAMVTFNTGAIPPENSLLSRFAPANWQATAYGLKFIIAFGFSGLGIWTASKVLEVTGSFAALYVGLSAAIALAALVVTLLPADAPARAAQPAPAE